MRLHKTGTKPHKFNHKDFIYDLIENTSAKKKEPLDVILTQYVEGVGEKGDRLTLKRAKAYNEFLLPGLAVYASSENIEKYLNTEKVKKTFSSIYVPLTLKTFQQCCLPVNMSVENPWVIEKWHIRANFRKIGIYVPDEAITMPEKQISGPNLDFEGKEFYVIVTINKTEKVTVRCRLHHATYDYSKELMLDPEYWKIPGEAIFPEDQEVLDSLPRPSWETNVQKKKVIT